MSATGSYLLAVLALGTIGGSGAGGPPIGAEIGGFQLADTRGGARRLDDWRDSRLVVVAFLRPDCPVSELYAERLAGLVDAFESRGVAFLGVGPGGREAPAALDRFAASHGLRFPILIDEGGELAARLGARRTPEVVVLGDRRAIRYRGRIDDQYDVGSRRPEPGRHDLAIALEELLGGRPVGRPEIEAVGCPIGRPETTSGPVEVTYGRDVAPIFQRRCVPCHRPGQVGPFSLTSYGRVVPWAGAIAEAVEDRRMPPWHADPRYGQFANDPSLTDPERRLIVDWVEAGAPEGDSSDPPPTVDVPGGWRIPEPDVVVAMERAFRVPAEGVVEYQLFEVDPGFREDTWVRAAEIRPGNRRVVHHCNVFLKAPDSGNEIDLPGALGSYCLAATTPGAPPMVLPDGMAKRVPAGWRLLFVVHYTPIGTVQEDRTGIGLVLADPKTVRKEVATNLMLDPDLRIPPHAADHRVEHTRRFDRDVLLISMFPHMHLRGKSFRYEARYPDGRREILLDVPRYDFNWQNRYDLAAPKRLPAGTTLHCVAHFDNSSGNPSNPDPDATVLAGQQTWDEMFNGYYDIALADQDLTRPQTRREILQAAARACSVPGLRLVGAACVISSLLLLLGWHRRAEPDCPD